MNFTKISKTEILISFLIKNFKTIQQFWKTKELITKLHFSKKVWKRNSSWPSPQKIKKKNCLKFVEIILHYLLFPFQKTSFFFFLSWKSCRVKVIKVRCLYCFDKNVTTSQSKVCRLNQRFRWIDDRPVRRRINKSGIYKART